MTNFRELAARFNSTARSARIDAAGAAVIDIIERDQRRTLIVIQPTRHGVLQHIETVLRGRLIDSGDVMFSAANDTAARDQAERQAVALMTHLMSKKELH